MKNPLAPLLCALFLWAGCKSPLIQDLGPIEGTSTSLGRFNLDSEIPLSIHHQEELITLSWQNPPGESLVLELTYDSRKIVYGGHRPGQAEFYLEQKGLWGEEVLEGRYMLWDTESGSWSFLSPFSLDMGEITGRRKMFSVPGAGIPLMLEPQEDQAILRWFNPATEDHSKGDHPKEEHTEGDQHYVLSLWKVGPSGEERIVYGGHRASSAELNFLDLGITSKQTVLRGSFMIWQEDQWTILPEFFLDLAEYYPDPWGGLPPEVVMQLEVLKEPYGTGQYQKVEEAARALVPLVSLPLVEKLIQMALGETELWTRRSAFRVIGRLAQEETTTEVLIGTARGMVQEALLQAISDQEDVLQEVLWIADSFYFPFFSIKEHAIQILTNQENSSSLRFRAYGVFHRLLEGAEEFASEEDWQLLTALLEDPDYWIRSKSAYIFSRIPDWKFNQAMLGKMLPALLKAYQNESELTAKVYRAKALDRFQGTESYQALRRDYEATHLGTRFEPKPGLLFWSGLEAEELEAYAEDLLSLEEAFFFMLGDGFREPLDDWGSLGLKIVIFADPDRYQEYMSSFVGYGSGAGGLFLESHRTLYTYQRQPHQSVYTLQELLRHEYTHALNALHIFPVLWSESGFHQEAKGWLDEGLAEVFAGLVWEDNEPSLPIREVHRGRLAQREILSLEELMLRRAGYDEAGTWDCEGGWDLLRFFLEEESELLHSLLRAFREDRYRWASWLSLTGRPLQEISLGFEDYWRRISQQE